MSSWTVSFPHISECPETLKSPTEWWMEMSFNNLWHYHTNGDIVLAAQRAFKAAGLSEQILMHFSDLTFIWNFSTQAKITYILARKTV